MSEFQQIRFPDRIKVESKDISVIKETINHLSNWLHEDFKKIIEPLQVLLQIPRILSEFQQKMVGQFSILFKNQIETLVIARQANIRVLKKKIELIGEHIDKRERQLKEAKERITERYKTIRERLIEQHEKYLTNLDNHAFKILQEIYPKEIQEKFSYALIPTQNYIFAHTQDSAVARYELLKSKYESAVKSINKFLSYREEFYDYLKQIGNTSEQPGLYGLPFYFVEVEDIETGKRSTDIYFDWELDKKEIALKGEIIQKLRDLAFTFVDNDITNDHTEDLNPEKIEEYLSKESYIPEKEIARFIQDIQELTIIKGE